MAVTLYGITTCDTVRKARNWLDAKGIAYRFHDFRAEGLERLKAESWMDTLGWEAVLNRQSTSFKALPPADQTGLDRAKALGLILANPTIVKRPVLERSGDVMVGFKPERYAEAFA
ncbi:MAG: arsenate reductase [Phreatobacter sp.]|uniref:arsenate reductase n=1 Tax=Phreatobacter sp. TaxID=1966341 RepID=UPI001A5719E9|nr:arsenate reductase [Phreatobacter sp.]MBL8568348.1 arsenate reductase [Phreatobacter sp.]